MAGQSISVASADQMVSNYLNYMSDLGVNMEEQTQSVGFSITGLISWLNSVSGDSDEIKIFMGQYGDESPNAGRTTVILWPFKNGSPAVTDNDVELDPFNDGTGEP